MFRERFSARAVSSKLKEPVSPRWHLNGVPLNVRTGLLAAGLWVAIVLLADLSYRVLAVGATDMTLPALPLAVDSPDEIKTPARRPGG